mmetsp:Transcript_12329/g.18393  ORF Transcript_12329/g.18393 Transcript_12329/m.18393 type:complete len:660 (+) Transcript_12329:125-2104(+)
MMIRSFIVYFVFITVNATTAPTMSPTASPVHGSQTSQQNIEAYVFPTIAAAGVLMSICAVLAFRHCWGGSEDNIQTLKRKWQYGDPLQGLAKMNFETFKLLPGSLDVFRAMGNVSDRAWWQVISYFNDTTLKQRETLKSLIEHHKSFKLRCDHFVIKTLSPMEDKQVTIKGKLRSFKAEIISSLLIPLAKLDCELLFKTEIMREEKENEKLFGPVETLGIIQRACKGSISSHSYYLMDKYFRLLIDRMALIMDSSRHGSDAINSRLSRNICNQVCTVLSLCLRFICVVHPDYLFIIRCTRRGVVSNRLVSQIVSFLSCPAMRREIGGSRLNLNQRPVCTRRIRNILATYSTIFSSLLEIHRQSKSTGISIDSSNEEFQRILKSFLATSDFQPTNCKKTNKKLITSALTASFRQGGEHKSYIMDISRRISRSSRSSRSNPSLIMLSSFQPNAVNSIATTVGKASSTYNHFSNSELISMKSSPNLSSLISLKPMNIDDFNDSQRKEADSKPRHRSLSDLHRLSNRRIVSIKFGKPPNAAKDIDNLPDDWQRVTDKGQRAYYFNRKTNETRWNPPEAEIGRNRSRSSSNMRTRTSILSMSNPLFAPSIAFGNADEIKEQIRLETKKSPALPAGWRSAMDSERRRMYYYNRKLGIRSWERPKE